MKTKAAMLLLSLILLIHFSQLNIVSPVRGQSFAELKVTRVVWGDNPDSPT